MTMDKFSLEHPSPTPSRKKRNSLSRDDEGLPLPSNKRVQSSIVITGRDGKIVTKEGPIGNASPAPDLARSKSNAGRIRKQLLDRKTAEFDIAPAGVGGRRVSPCTPLKPPSMRQAKFSTPQPTRKDSSAAHNPFLTPWRLPKTPLMSDYISTPTTQSTKMRPPMSSNKKLRSRAMAKLQMLNCQELETSRLAQARQDLFVERQERAYVSWLNHILIDPKQRVVRPSNSVTLSTRATPASVDANSTTSGGLKLIDEVYWDEDCLISSPRHPTGVGRSPRNPLVPLKGMENRLYESPDMGAVHHFKRSLKDMFSTPERKPSQLQSPASTPHLSSKRLKMITEHGISYPRDAHMADVCRLSELARRMKLHFNQMEREEILAVITQLAKHIDEGRLKMKRGCAILTDVALRKKALEVLLNYNAYWLRIGLHIVLGHTALLKERLNEDEKKKQTADRRAAQDAEFALLEVFLERHFLAHPGLAKKFATNKAIEGLYRDGYSESLGRVILKRFFLLVLVLDMAKSQTALKIVDGIDGVDGGSPPLFRADARVKSSRQALQDFLSDVMYGEGDVIGNLNALGYHVHHCQVPLADYNFEVVDLGEDLKDGVRLCRLVQLLTANDTRFLQLIQVPSNGRKRRIHNCQIALESLAQAGVPLEDEDGCTIDAGDIVGGNKERMFSLLWNIMVHLQIPLLVSRPRLCEEIASLQGSEGGVFLGLNIGTVELLLKWAQVACMIAGNLIVRNFQTSFADGQAFCLIINLYLPTLLPKDDLKCPTSSNPEVGEQAGSKTRDVSGTHGSIPNCEYKKVVAHNFSLVDAVVAKLGCIPQVLQLMDLLGDPVMSERNIIIFVAFLCSRLLDDRARELKVPQERRSVAPKAAVKLKSLLRYSSQCNLESESPCGYNRSYLVPWSEHEAVCSTNQPPFCVEDDDLQKVRKIQAWWRSSWSRRSMAKSQNTARINTGAKWRSFATHLCNRDDSALMIQTRWRGHSVRRNLKKWNAAATLIQWSYRIHVQRLQARVQAAQVLQYYFRAWAQRRKHLATVSNMCKIQALWWVHEARGKFLKERRAVQKIESEWLLYLVRKRFHIAQLNWQMGQSAQVIQAHWRGHSLRRALVKQARAACIIQRWFRRCVSSQCHGQQGERTTENLDRTAPHYRGIRSIQAFWRGRVGRRKLAAMIRAATFIQRRWRYITICSRKQQLFTIAVQAAELVTTRATIKIQTCWRGHAARRNVAIQRRAAIEIQRKWRSLLDRRKQHLLALASQAANVVRIRSSIRIQARWRCHILRRDFKAQRRAAKLIQVKWRDVVARRLLKRQVYIITLLQARWRCYSARESFTMMRAKVLTIQRHHRGYTERKEYRRLIHSTVIIQSRRRAVIQSAKYQAIKRSASRIQSWWAARLWRSRFLSMRSSAQTIQRFWRHFIHRRRSRNAVLIQRRWRSFCARKVYGEAAFVIQRHYRGHLHRKSFMTMRKSVVVIQACYRAFAQQQRYRVLRTAAITIQAEWKGWIQRRSFEASLGRIRRLQATWKGRRVRAQFHNCKRVLVNIQRSWRQFLLMSRMRQEAAALRIQSMWVSYLVRRQVLRWTAACIIIQKHYRGYTERRQLDLWKNAVVKCQAIFRGKYVRRRTEACQGAATQIQAFLRGALQRHRFRAQRNATCKIQAIVRDWYARKTAAAQIELATLLHRRSAKRIQRAWKKYRSRRLGTSTTVHTPNECKISDEGTPSVREDQRRSSSLNEDSQPGSKTLKIIDEDALVATTLFTTTRTAAALIIQKYVRRQSAKAKSQRLSSSFSTTTSEQDIRIQIREGNTETQFEAARLTENCGRERLYSICKLAQYHGVDSSLSNDCAPSSKELCPEKLRAGSTILGWLRTFVQRTNYLRLRRQVVEIQKFSRGWIIRLKYARLRASVVLIQASWRGYDVRRRSRGEEDDSFAKLRQRMKSTAAAVQDGDRLCNRLTVALSLLLHEKTVSGILTTCRTIDVATEHSLTCCEKLAECGAITTLLHLMQTMNRSPPLEQVLKHALSIINNLARHGSLATRIAQTPSAVSIITEQLHAFRNNEQIFAKAISVLKMVCTTSAGIRVLLKERPVFRRFQVIASSLERKVLVERRNLEKLSRAPASAAQKKSAQKRMGEANSQFLCVINLMKEINRLAPFEPTSVAMQTPMPRRCHSELFAITPAAEAAANTARKWSVRPSASTAARIKRVSTPLYYQRPPLFEQTPRRVTDLPFRETHNLF